MDRYRRIFAIVIDSLGIGEADDAEKYHDKGANTLGHISEKMDDFAIPNLQKLGIANLCSLKQIKPAVGQDIGK